MSPGGRPPPPTARLTAYSFFFFAIDVVTSLRPHRCLNAPAARSRPSNARLPPLPLLGCLLLAALLRLSSLRHGRVHPLVGWLVPHRFATKVGGLLPPPALVVVEIGV